MHTASSFPGFKMQRNYYQQHSVTSVTQFGSSDGTTGAIHESASATTSNRDDDSTIKGSGLAPGYSRVIYGSNASRYKLMSPAKLPISRPPCFTTPSLLDSPVLLSNMKVDPSPTTGSLQKPQILYSPVLLSSTNNSSNITQVERNSSNFESKHLNLSNSGRNISSSAPLASAGSTSKQCEPFAEIQDQGQPQSLTSLTSVEMQQAAASSRDVDLSATAAANQPPVNRLILGTCLPTEISPQNQQNHVFYPVAQALHPDHKEANSASVMSEKSSNDGYNWRKYGQKLVKGSEFPRSYYKCTHPNCQVKKLFEQSHDGRIAEIIYKGKHDHPKPQPRRRFAIGTEENLDKFSLNSAEDKTSNAHGQTSYHRMPDSNHELPPVTPRDDGHDDDKDNDDPDSKRRKQDLGVDVISLVKPTREPRVVVQTMSEVDILDDGYRWRKYGQKVVKGNPNPRSYYKCTDTGCPVRKLVERASHDPKAVITTYEGKHSHDVPVSKSSNHDKAGTNIYTVCADAIVDTRLEETGAISLDLGVGIGFTPENESNETTRRMEASSVSTYYGFHNDDDDQDEIRENPGGSFRFETPTLNPSTNTNPQSTESLLMGP